MESDEGTFQPSGLGFSGSAEAQDIVKEIMSLLQPINVTDVFEPADGTDIAYWMRDGVPGECPWSLAGDTAPTQPCHARWVVPSFQSTKKFFLPGSKIYHR